MLSRLTSQPEAAIIRRRVPTFARLASMPRSWGEWLREGCFAGIPPLRRTELPSRAFGTAATLSRTTHFGTHFFHLHVACFVAT